MCDLVFLAPVDTHVWPLETMLIVVSIQIFQSCMCLSVSQQVHTKRVKKCFSEACYRRVFFHKPF